MTWWAPNRVWEYLNFVISRMFFIFLYELWAPLGKIKLNQFQPGEWCFLGRSEGSTFTEKLIKFNPHVNEELKNFKQLNKFKNFTVSVISCVFFIFLYELWAPLGKIKLNQFQQSEWCFLGRSEGSTFTEKLMKFNPPSQWGIKRLQTTEQAYKLYSFSNILRVFHLFVLTLCYGLCHSCASHIKRR